MDPYIYLGVLILYSLYYLSQKSSISFEVLCIFALIAIAPKIIFRDFDMYLEEFDEAYPVYAKSLGSMLSTGYRLLYLISYPICYYSFWRLTNANKTCRYIFFCFSFFTLGLNQLYLCIGLIFYFNAHRCQSKVWIILLLAAALVCHVSIAALLIFDLYGYSKKLAFIAAFAIIVVLYLFQDQLLMLSFLDARVGVYANSIDAWEPYNIRNQIYTYVALFIVCFIRGDKKWILGLLLIMLFSISIYHQNAVMVRRFVELFLIGWIWQYTLIQHKTTQDWVAVIVLIVFTFRNFFDYVSFA